MSRPDAKNVFYFPHYTKSTIELDLIEHKHGSEGYKAYYRLQEMVGDADYHRLSIATEDEKDMFDLGMNCKQEVVDDVIRILLDRGRIDRELWEKESVIWMQDFVDTLKPVYVNRRKPLPDKNIVSTCSNTEKRKEKKIKGKESRENDDSLLSLDEYQKQFPDKNVDKSLSKYLDFVDNPSHEGAMNWLTNEKEKKKPQFRKSPTGFYIAYCSKCGVKHTPKDKWQINEGSTCCREEYVPEPIKQAV